MQCVHPAGGAGRKSSALETGLCYRLSFQELKFSLSLCSLTFNVGLSHSQVAVRPTAATQ